jgi:hypothetical protein
MLRRPRAAEKERWEAEKWVAAGASTATRASTMRAAADIARNNLPWRSTHLPYLAGGSPHGWIEQRRDVGPQEAVRRSSIRHPGEEGEEEVVAGGTKSEETTGTSPVGAGSAAAEGEEGAGWGRRPGPRGRRAQGWIERREVGMGEMREIPRDGDGVSNLLEVLHLPKFPHFEGEGGDRGPVGMVLYYITLYG